MDIPKHIAIIMDGDRRWAKKQGLLSKVAGHQKVADEILEPLIENAAKKGVQYLTFWAWSTENWKRSEEEVLGMMNLFRHVIKNRWSKLHKKGVRVKTIGNLDQFPKDIASSLHDVIEQTKNNTKITVIFALNYGGRDEIIRAINKIRKNVAIDDEITKENFGEYLDTEGIPDPELIVRTGGEQRLSGFLLWQSEYSELYFPTWYMPEFTEEKFDEIVEVYASRKRRFGK